MRIEPHIASLVIVSLMGVVCAAEETATARVESVVLRPLHEAEVSAQRTGMLSKMFASEGEHVEKGQLLASLDSREAKLAVAKAEVEHAQAEVRANNEVRLQYAEKSLEVARAELQRSRESIQKFAKSISQSQVDVERLTVEKLTLERRQAEHELRLERFSMKLRKHDLEAARLQLEQHSIRSPFAGIVVEVAGRAGEWVEIGTPVFRLVAVDRLRGEGFLQAEQVTKDLVGKSVRMTVIAAGHPMKVTGQLRFVSPETDPVTKQVRVWAEVPNEDGRLRPGQQGTLEIFR
ncbi:MAG: efflux RND transporter periplasmic adaptor subunit [Pirellulales bacterium]|nr:efflux RND transporter periplasmic adaptor subunit [Pirellulales bacterium]